MRAPAFMIAALTAAFSFAEAAPSNLHDRTTAFDWGTDKVRGVNIGGWLVLEPFITPSIFQNYSSDDWPIYDEWSLCEKLGRNACTDVLKPHWETFVSLDDFWKIKAAGFNIVRIPVGYWSYVDPWGPYIQGAAPYLDAAVDWARETGLKIVIDLHGAPKSQNGFDHSGHRVPWPMWGDSDSLSCTHAALKQIEQKYATPDMQDVIVAIQFLNEPFLLKLDPEMVKQFYRDAFYNLREISDMPAMLHDGFENPWWLNNFLDARDNNARNVIVDHHEYQIFDSGTNAMSINQHVSNYDGSDKWTIVGEWSGAFTDCAPHLNGFNVGSRMEGSFPGSYWISSCAGKSGPVSSWSQEWKDSVRRYIEVQLEAYEARTRGWIFWNFKTEGGAGEWDLFQLLDYGVFPQPLDDRWFSKMCQNF
ncbi:glucan 1,3-beta-glucosidase precursor [Stemphylium lycopersici]|uniref:Glucan 1,3-beta-glucosidase n=1 Tax=Stemphylium lycopersici TaxID=183478 RepID=A0A364N0T6_STELY|nr:glucan 1,3-beta-glucosidase precursor [Stemphylium lycopersici]RAR08960.1 glucan 1,3-beta-glucosidase precursor [Stemphylium lycopersici]